MYICVECLLVGLCSLVYYIHKRYYWKYEISIEDVRDVVQVTQKKFKETNQSF